MRKWAWISGAILLLVLPACRQGRETTESTEPQVPTTQSQRQRTLGLEFKPEGKQTEDRWKYLATYTCGDKKVRFGVEFRLRIQTPELQRISARRNGIGSFISRSGTDSSCLRAALADLLGVQNSAGRSIRVRELPFSFVVEGQDQDRTNAGVMVDAERGQWTSTSLAFGVGPAWEPQLVLNFQQGGGQAEFVSPRNRLSYSASVLRELAKVF